MSTLACLPDRCYCMRPAGWPGVAMRARALHGVAHSALPSLSGPVACLSPPPVMCGGCSAS